MTPLTAKEIKGLQRAARSLMKESWMYSCTAIKIYCSTRQAEYPSFAGVETNSEAFCNQHDIYDSFERQLARSLAVLMFIEANRPKKKRKK